MFNWFKKKEKPPQTTIRDTLFGDLPMVEWPSDSSLNTEPWVSFIQARKYLERMKGDAAITTLKTITDMPGLEPRHYLQAWHFLRRLHVEPPPDKAKLVYGVIVEVAVQGGADLIAAYADHTARYLHHRGGGVIWEHPDTSLDAEIDTLLSAGQAVANVIGPSEQGRPPAPQGEDVMLSMLTPSGLHFGYGSFKTIYEDPKGKAIIDPATRLMQGLTAKNKR